jgi:hypothetical protein
MRSLLLIPALALSAAVFAQAQPAASPVSIVSKVEAVTYATDAKGVKKRILVEPKIVTPGQPLVVWLTYRNNGKVPASAFVINNKVPNNTDFTGFGETSGWGVVSVDGGKTFGPIAALKVTGKDGKVRTAGFKDVTHLRWAFAKPIPAGTGGVISFYGVVQ